PDDFAIWDQHAEKHRQAFKAFLQTYHPSGLLPLAGGGFFKLLPVREHVWADSTRESEKEKQFWGSFRGKTLVLVEPHPDDVAISMDVTARRLVAAGAIVYLVTVTTDRIGVTDEFAVRKLFGEHGIEILKAGKYSPDELERIKTDYRSRESKKYPSEV